MSITKLQDWLSTAKERNRENRGITKPRQVTPLLRLIENSIPLVPSKDHADTLLEKLSNLKCSQNQNEGKLPAEDMHLLCTIIAEIISHAAHHSPKTNRCVDIKAVRDELVKYTSVDHFIVCDLEMTVPPDGCADFIREIIEIGIVVLDKNFEQLDTFETLVKPTKNPTLSTLCTKITGITQAMVNPAPVYIEAHTEMLEFLKPYTASSLFVQYGSGDHYQIIKDCELHDINLGFDMKVCNFKKTISKSGLISRKQRGLAKALSTCGIERHGDPHRALNDAIDTASLMIHTIQHLKSL